MFEENNYFADYLPWVNNQQNNYFPVKLLLIIVSNVVVGN